MRDVAFSCDNNGAPFLQVTVWSLLEHYKGTEPLRINVFEGWGGHSAENKAKLQAIVDGFNELESRVGVGERRASSNSANTTERSDLHSPTPTLHSNFFFLRYHNVEAAVAPYADVIMNREKSRWNVFTWTPIFTPQILSDAEGNVAHFDIDMLFNDDVSKILDTDLGDNLIACVAEYAKGDPVITEAVWGKGILPDSVERYFNTGTIVFNTEKCREEKTWEKIVAWYRDHYEIADRIEQDAWNALYHDRTLLLPLRWNFHDRLIKSFAKWNPFVKYWQGNPPRECYEAALNPAILHFWGPKKPWKPSHRPYRKLYHAAMRAVGQTPPRPEFFACLHAIKTWRQLRRIRLRLKIMEEWNIPIGGEADFQGRMKEFERWEKRLGGKAVKHALLVPFEWLGIGLGVLILSSLPHRLMQGLCDLAAAVMYRFDGRGKRRSLENLHVALGCLRGDEGTPKFRVDVAPYDPTPREERIIRGAYRNMARTVGHAFWTCRGALKKVRAVGLMDDSCQRFLAEHNPAVTVSGHIGCWEILSQLAFLHGHRMMSVAKRIGTSGMTRLLIKARESIGQEIVPADGAFRPLMAGIKSGKSLGLLVDQRVDPSEGGIWIRFFGQPMTVSAAPAFFAAKAKAPIIIAWSRPLPSGGYRCEQLDTISADEAKDIWRTTKRCAIALERIIRRHPSKWVLNYNFFSNVPTEKDLAQLAQREVAFSGGEA